MEFSAPDFGKMAYKAYGDYVGWKNFQGNPMPIFEELPDKIREAWRVAAREVMSIMNTYNMQRKDDE